LSNTYKGWGVEEKGGRGGGGEEGRGVEEEGSKGGEEEGE
jgi:hypothetical protein